MLCVVGAVQDLLHRGGVGVEDEPTPPRRAGADDLADAVRGQVGRERIERVAARREVVRRRVHKRAEPPDVGGGRREEEERRHGQDVVDAADHACTKRPKNAGIKEKEKRPKGRRKRARSGGTAGSAPAGGRPGGPESVRRRGCVGRLAGVKQSPARAGRPRPDGLSRGPGVW